MPETVATLQRAQVVRVMRLVEMQFASGAVRVHQGAGPLRTADGKVWAGIGQLGQVSDIERALLPSNGGPTLTLSGVDPLLIGKTLGSADEVKGRPVFIFDQHFNDGLGLLDAPLAVWPGLMDRMTITDSGATAAITVTTVTLLYNRRRPAFGYLNAASQRRLYPADGGADQLSRLVQATERWPAY